MRCQGAGLRRHCQCGVVHRELARIHDQCGSVTDGVGCGGIGGRLLSLSGRGARLHRCCGGVGARLGCGRARGIQRPGVTEASGHQWPDPVRLHDQRVLQGGEGVRVRHIVQCQGKRPVLAITHEGGIAIRHCRESSFPVCGTGALGDYLDDL